MITWNQVSGTVERIVLGSLTFAAGKGWISSVDLANLTGLVVTIMGAVWAYYVNRPASILRAATDGSIPAAQVAEAVVKMPEIKGIVTTAQVALDTPSREIVSKATQLSQEQH